MKPYLFAYSQACPQAHAHSVLNDTQGVDTWVSPFPHAAILVSRLNTQDLSAIIRERLPGVWFMVTEMTPQSVNGWLPGILWEYVNDPPKAWSRKLIQKLSPTPPDLAAARQGYARRPQPG